MVAAEPKAATAKDVSGAGLIAASEHQLEANNFQAAISYAASSKTPALDDYAQWIRAQAEYNLKNYDEVAHAVEKILAHTPQSPMTGDAAGLLVRSALDSGKPKEALDLIRKHYDKIPQPRADLLLAQCFQATGDLPQSAEYFQRVYYGYPSSKEATDAANALVDVKQKLGDAYPPAMPAQMLQRADKLFHENNPQAARIELMAAVNQLGGAERDVARVRIGVADYYANNTAAAFQYFSALKVDDAEADAERLAYLIRSARKLDRHADIKPFLDTLEKQHAASPWRMDALIYVADQARVDNDPSVYQHLYRACAATFNDQPRANWCHFQVAFDAYRRQQPEAFDLLRAYLQHYAQTDDANDALYFLGRWNEAKGDYAAARACYERIAQRFPNTYYAVAARTRLEDVHVSGANPDPETVQFLDKLNWPPLPQFPSFTPGKVAQSRLDRAQLLRIAGLTDFAEGELKFGAKVDGEQQNVYALELARMAAARNAPELSMRYIRTYAPGYLFMPLDQAPIEFWKLAFPIPYRPQIEQFSKAQGLDPYLVAALIRQESEFNVKAVSVAKAYGLMQLLPTTGKQLARHFGMRRFRTAQLLTATNNIQLGTYFFHNLLADYNGQVEVALASYNAGPGRANLWRTWGPFREQAEFVETIPFHETRLYVQIVLRNADVYRRLYANSTPDVPQYHPKPAPAHRKRARSATAKPKSA